MKFTKKNPDIYIIYCARENNIFTHSYGSEIRNDVVLCLNAYSLCFVTAWSQVATLLK